MRQTPAVVVSVYTSATADTVFECQYFDTNASTISLLTTPKINYLCSQQQRGWLSRGCCRVITLCLLHHVAGITCPAPKGQEANALFDCTDGYFYESECTMQCLDSYRPIPMAPDAVKVPKCLITGQWSTDKWPWCEREFVCVCLL